MELTREQLREQAEANRRTQELIEEGQVTERYTKAIEQLGSSTVDVRLGGIYAMERIAIDSPRDSSPIGEVLLAFTRDHISDSRPRPTKGADADPSTKNDMSPLRPDVRAAMDVLSRAEKSRKWRVSLSDMDISYLDMPIASLQRALLGSTKFVGSNLAHANLRDADATEADFTDADLTDADLQGTSLGGACFIRATLVGAMFRETDLEGADLTDSNLTGAFLNDVVLTEANLTDADLTGVDLSHADLEGADLTGATVDQGASLPSGWHRDPAKGVVVSDDGT